MAAASDTAQAAALLCADRVAAQAAVESRLAVGLRPQVAARVGAEADATGCSTAGVTALVFEP